LNDQQLDVSLFSNGRTPFSVLLLPRMERRAWGPAPKEWGVMFEHLRRIYTAAGIAPEASGLDPAVPPITLESAPLLFDGVVDYAIYVLSPDGRIASWNVGAESLFGYQADQVVGFGGGVLFPAGSVSDHATWLAKATPALPAADQQWREKHNGDLVLCDVSLTAIADDETKSVQGYLEIVRELSAAEVQTESVSVRLAEQSRELVERNKELDRFASVASHDLKAPLRGIVNLAEWISEDVGDQLPEVSRDHLQKLRARASRLTDLLDGLLEYSRAPRGGIEPEHIDTREMIQNIADLLSPPEGIKITFQGDAPSLHAPRAPLEQVFRNLLENSIKHHGGEVGRIDVFCRELPEHYEFTVQDDGQGIELESHERIFEMFQTLKPRDEVEGSGMGLAIIKKIVSVYGGQVALDSEPGRGAAFRFTWPKRIESPDLP